MQNHFELFHLPATFAIDTAALERAFHEVQNQVHPDKFSVASDAEKRVAMQWATRANEAYQTLKNPLKRATYLCELHGVDLQVESNTAMPRDFLMQQMTWREELDDARSGRDAGALDRLDAALRQSRQDTVAEIAGLLGADEHAAAGQAVRKLMFIERFADEVAACFDQIA